ncbi:MAG: signal peptide peptidase SppA, partial [Methanoregula sp.]|nr:signal peptide peptidase SppA [Methanoregula sp.]
MTDAPVAEPVSALPDPAPAVTEPAAAGRIPAGLKWFILIIIGLIVISGLCIGAYYLAQDDIRSVSIVRMEGTMITGNYEDEEVIGSEVVGRNLRQAADDPMVEAIVLRVNSPGGTPAAAQEIIG